MSILALLFFAIPLLAAAAEVPEYELLRDARPDGRSVAVENLEIMRDAHNFEFTSGTFHFLAPASGGRSFGAVFIGEGRYELHPGMESERKHLQIVAGDRNLEVLSDTFDRLVILFTDTTASEIAAGRAVTTGAPSAEASRIYEDYLKQQKAKLQINLHLRLLRDLLGGTPEERGVFLAMLDGRKLAPALIAVDPSGIGNLAAGLAFFGGEESAFISLDEEGGGFWYLAGSGNASHKGKPLKMAVDALHYTVDTTIASNLSIDGATTVTVRPLVAGIRVLPLHILPKLRLREASYVLEGAEPARAAIVQEEVELGRFKRLFQDETGDADAALVFPEALPAGSRIELRLRYEGRDVLRSLGADSYSVRARESWYPNLGTFTDPATYELTFRYPKRNNLVATGALIEEKTEDDQKVSVWRSEGAMRVAGFNFGRFEKASRTDEQSGASIDVYTHRDFRKMSGDSMIDAINASRVATAFFGKHSYQRVSVTQQSEWSFGQSWPTLIYLPTLALTTSTDRAFMLEELGAAVFDVQEFAKMVGWHEIAHQWWGHQVGWQSYRDQWLSEGLAEFTAALVLQMTESTAAYNSYWDRRRQEILENAPRISAADAGPISNGIRLSTRANPRAAQTIIYSKGAWVVQMLRRMMNDPAKENSDALFIAMMRDFVTTWTGKNPATSDFQKIVEKHMAPPMNATGNGSMGYFFNQWVYGTEIPRLTSNLSVSKAGGGKYRIQGTITQAEVSEEFRTIVPIYLDYGKDSIAKLGQMVLVGSSSTPIDVEIALPREPRRVVINAMQDVLTRK